MRFTHVSHAVRFLKILGPHESNQKWPRVNGDSAVNGNSVRRGFGTHAALSTRHAGLTAEYVAQPDVIPGRCAASNPESRGCGARFRVRSLSRAPRNDGAKKIWPRYCVFGECGLAWVMNCVASTIAVPTGVGTTMRNGTKRRVPGSGAKAISILRADCRYLITGRSGI
jgi:hypothetical protein